MIETTERQIDERVNGILEGMRNQLAAAKAVGRRSGQETPGGQGKDLEVTARTRPYYIEKAKLEQLKRFEEVLFFRAGQDKMNVNMPTEHVVEIIDKAEPNPRPVRPNKPVNIALGIIIGLVVGMGLAFFIEYLDTSVKTIDDVERTLQAPVLGVIPQNVGYLLEEGAESPHAEAYRVLRTNLLFSRKDEKLNTIAVVSAGAGEGKSTTVCNLATVFAQGGQRVLMVDSDLRRPTLHKLLQVNNTLGLTNYLLKQNTLEEVIQTIQAALPGFHGQRQAAEQLAGHPELRADEGFDHRIEAPLRFHVFRFAADHGRERRLHPGQRGGHDAAGHPVPPLSAADEHPGEAID